MSNSLCHRHVFVPILFKRYLDLFKGEVLQLYSKSVNTLTLHSQTKNFLNMLEIFPNTYTYNLFESLSLELKSINDVLIKKTLYDG